MGLASSKYDVLLNSQGYLLVEESYQERAQQSFVPRFSTGDPSAGDLSFWQFLKQEAWGGGAGQTVFSTVSKHQRSTGWSFLRGKPALCGGDSVVAAVSPTQILDEEYNSLGFPYLATMHIFGKAAAARPKVLLSGKKSDNTATVTISSLRAVSSSLVGIDQVLANCSALFQRTQLGSYTSTCLAIAYNDGANKIRYVDYAGTNMYEYTIAPPGGGTFVPRCMIALSDDKFFACGPGSYNSGYGLVLLRQDISSGTWTSVNSYYGFSTIAPEIPSPHACLDSSGTLYVCSVSDAVAQTTELAWSSVSMFTTADLLNATGPIISSVVPYPDFIFAGCFAIAGTPYMIGVRKRKAGASTYYRACVVKFPGTVIWESEYESTSLMSVMPRAFYQVSRNEVIFINSKLDSGEAQSIMRLTLSDVVEEVACFSKDVTGTRVRIGALIKFGTSYYGYDIANNNFRLATIDPSDNLAVASTRSLKLSRMGGNTDLINKTLYSVTVELSEAISTSQTLTIKVNGTTVGTMVPADGTRKEITLTTEITGSYFEPTFEMPSTATWPGTIEKVYLRYVPTQFKKKAWSFMVRATKNLRLIDGTRETSTAPALFSAIKTAWLSNIPVTFVDIDGTSHTVLVTDYKRRVPLPDRAGGTEVEQLCAVELLEV